MSAGDAVDEGLGDDAKKLIRKFTNRKDHVSVDKDDLIASIAEKQEEKQTFLRLPFTVLFFTSFAMFALGHEHIGDSSLVQREIRSMLEGTTYEGVWATSGHKDMGDIDTKEDIYNYLKEAVVPLFINPIATPNNERHRALRYNRVIGGIVLQQIRRNTVNCGTQYPKLGPFSTADEDGGKKNPILDNFDCYPWNTEADDCFGPAFTGKAREGFCPDSKVFEEAAKKKSGGRRLDFVPDGGGTGGASKGKMPPPANRSYYSVYLYEHEGLATALAKINTLEKDAWVDYNTAWLGVRVLVLNPGLQIFVHATINVYMPPGGAMLPKVTAQSFQTEPYLSKAVIFWDALYFFCIFLLAAMTLRTMIGEIRHERAKAYFKDPWNWLDLLAVMTSLAVGMMFVSLLGVLDKTKNAAMDAREAEPLPGQSSGTYPSLVADLHVQMIACSDYLNTWRLVLCWYTLLIALKFLESFAKQPRLAVVTKTILRAGPDFFHFFIVCFIIFFSFVVSGMFIFGRRLWNWSSITLATNEAFLLVMGDFDYDELTMEYPLTAQLWFWAFIFLIQMLLLNMLMAIIMDVYTEVKADASGFATIWAQMFEILQDQVDIISGKSVSSDELLRVLNEVSDEELNEDTLMNCVGPGLAREQAAKMLEETQQAVDDRLQGAVSMTEAIRMVAWVKIAVQKINIKLEDLVVAEQVEEATMLAQANADEEPNAADGAIVPGDSGDGPIAAYLAQSATQINRLESRMKGMESLMSDSMNFTGSRGKDLRDRMQVIEDLLKSQRDALVRGGRDPWDQKPQITA